MVIEKVHISRIRIGDTVCHNNKIRTVCNRTLKYSEFMGVTLFGDSYNIGYKMVEKVIDVN